MKNKADIKQNFIFTTLTAMISGLVNTVYPIIFGLIFSATIMGQFAILYSWINFLGIPIANGVAPAIMRFIAADVDDETDRLEKLGLQFSLIYFLIISICVVILDFTIFKLGLIDIFFIILLLLLTISHFIFKKSLQGRENFDTVFKIEFVSFICFIFGFFCLIVTFIMFDGVLIVAWALLIPVLIYHLVFGLIYNKSKTAPSYQKIFTFNVSKFQSKRVLRYSLLVGVGSLLGLGISQIQIIVSDLYLTDYEIGVLGFWKYVVAPLSLFSVAFSTLLIARITNLKKFNDELAMKLVNSINWIFVLIFVPLSGFFILLFAYYPMILDIFTFSKYQMTVYWPVFAFLFFHAIDRFLTTPSTAYVSSSEALVKINPIISFVFSLTTIISWFVFVPSFQVFGFAMGLALGGFFSQILRQLHILRETKGKIGIHLLFFITMNVILGIILFFSGIIPHYIIILFWCALNFPFLLIGLYRSYGFMTEKSFTIHINIEH